MWFRCVEAFTLFFFYKHQVISAVTDSTNTGDSNIDFILYVDVL